MAATTKAKTQKEATKGAVAPSKAKATKAVAERVEEQPKAKAQKAVAERVQERPTEKAQKKAQAEQPKELSKKPSTLCPQTIAERAYFIWLERGRAHGNDQEDWATAESQLAEVLRN